MICLFPAKSFSAVYVNEGFEGNSFDGTPEGYIGSDGSCTTGGTECSVTAGTCTGCDGVTNKVFIQSSVVHSGSYALKGQFVSTAGAASFKLIDTRYGITFPTTIYVRFYIRWDSAFRFYSASKVFERSFNYYFTIRGVTSTSNWGGADNTPYGMIGMYSSDQSAKTVCGAYTDDLAGIAMSRQCTNSDGANWIIDLTNPDHIGWWYFEVMIDMVNDKFSVWVKRPKDTSVTQVFNEMAWTFNNNTDEIHWMWLNDCGTGKGGGIVYVDDVVVANEYIGPTEESTPTRTLNNVTGVRVTLH